MKLQARNFVVRKPETIDITMFFKKFCIATRTSKSLGIAMVPRLFFFCQSASGSRFSNAFLTPEGQRMAAIWSAMACLRAMSRCPYMSAVILMSAWPIHSCTSFKPMPRLNSRLAQVCRRSLKLTVLVVENACTELVDVTSVMLQNLFNCIGVPSAGRANHRERQKISARVFIGVHLRLTSLRQVRL